MPNQVTAATSTTSKNIELAVVYDATGINKLAVLEAIEAFKLYVEQDNWPPV